MGLAGPAARARIRRRAYSGGSLPFRHFTTAIPALASITRDIEPAPAATVQVPPRPSAACLRGCLLLLLVVATLSQTGCVHRRMMIQTDPPGAAVMVDGEEAGYTPMALDFTYYGTREITLVKDGYKTLTLPAHLPTPWYQIFPLEFVTDNFALTKIRDYRDFTYRMEPDVIMPTQELLDRASGLRSDALRTEMPYHPYGR
jgi:hypothetical protein